MQNTSSGTAAKTPSSGAARPSSARADAVLEHEHDDAQRGADGEQVEGDRLQRHEHRSESDGKGEQRTADDEKHDERCAAVDRVGVVRVERGHPPTSRRVPASPLTAPASSARRSRASAGSSAPSRSSVGTTSIRASRSSRLTNVRRTASGTNANRGESGEMPLVIPGSERTRRTRRSCPSAVAIRAVATQPRVVERVHAIGQHDHDAQRLHDAAAPHRAQRARAAGRFGLPRQPVAARETRLESAGLRSEEQERNHRDEQRSHRPARDERRPAAPGRRTLRAPEREHAPELDTRAERRRGRRAPASSRGARRSSRR